MDPTRPAHGTLVVKVAETPREFDQIHVLNHRTFAGEIPQHAPTADGRLVDRFHDQNTYVIAVKGDCVVGMIAVRGERPFSLDARLPLDTYLPPGRAVCELRLLAVDAAHRSSRLVPLLLHETWRVCRQRGYEVAVVSGVLGQVPLYEHLGFVPFGPSHGTDDARFQPMMLTLERFRARGVAVLERLAPDVAPAGANLLPGPVQVAAEVRRAMGRAPVSHRDDRFASMLGETRQALASLTGAPNVVVAVGTGTLANDMVAAQLGARGGRGLIAVNGEFGERLCDHATRAGLDFDVLTAAWGDDIDTRTLATRLDAVAPAWLWMVHGETSTGILNDLDGVSAVCRSAGVALCVDAISTVGVLDVDLSQAALASAVSGKGLGAFPGLAIVTHDGALAPSRIIARSLDLRAYAERGGTPYTHSSNLVGALHAAVTTTDWPARYARVAECGASLRARLLERGCTIVDTGHRPHPAVVTVALPRSLSSREVARALAHEGHLASAHSDYLAARNWIQFCPMSHDPAAHLEAALEAFTRICGAAFSPVPTHRS